jgi:hypothetical protein
LVEIRRVKVEVLHGGVARFADAAHLLPSYGTYPGNRETLGRTSVRHYLQLVQRLNLPRGHRQMQAKSTSVIV